MTLGTLENTPDIRRLKGDRKLRRELLAWLRRPDNQMRIDAGVVALPRKYLAKRSTSVSPYGLSRLSNRPFAQLYDAQDFADLDFSAARHVRSPAALLRRLDDLSCAGCHQARSVAGFHLLGVDRDDTAPVNAIAISGSPHLLQDQPRRARFVQDLLEDTASDPTRPLSERSRFDTGTYGAHCGLGDPGFDDWTCAPGFSCRPHGAPVGDATVGICLPLDRAGIGDPCEPGRVRPHANPHRDRFAPGEPTGCSNWRVCEATPVGFPGGMCSGACTGDDADARCGSIALLAGFNRCLARSQPFTRCLADNVRPAALRKCANDMPCRDDYLCARNSRGEGVCIPHTSSFNSASTATPDRHCPNAGPSTKRRMNALTRHPRKGGLHRETLFVGWYLGGYCTCEPGVFVFGPILRDGPAGPPQDDGFFLCKQSLRHVEEPSPDQVRARLRRRLEASGGGSKQLLGGITKSTPNVWWPAHLIGPGHRQNVLGDVAQDHVGRNWRDLIKPGLAELAFDVRTPLRSQNRRMGLDTQASAAASKEASAASILAMFASAPGFSPASYRRSASFNHQLGGAHIGVGLGQLGN